MFYSKLYSSQFSKVDCDNLFQNLGPLIPQIDVSFKTICDAELKIDDLDAALKKMGSNKSPGSDGLTVNFYKYFWEDLRVILFEALKECIVKKELMTSMKRGNHFDSKAGERQTAIRQFKTDYIIKHRL